jgi:hypothetical protein
LTIDVRGEDVNEYTGFVLLNELGIGSDVGPKIQESFKSYNF